MHYVEPETLAHWLMEHPARVLVVDLRDRDYADGRVRGATHVPFCALRPADVVSSVPAGVTELVLHCHYSQMRAPTAAAAIMRAVSSRWPDAEGGGPCASGNGGAACGGHDRLYAPRGKDAPPFRVSVLRGGFEAWRDAFHANPVLYEPLSARSSTSGD